MEHFISFKFEIHELVDEKLEIKHKLGIVVLLAQGMNKMFELGSPPSTSMNEEHTSIRGRARVVDDPQRSSLTHWH